MDKWVKYALVGLFLCVLAGFWFWGYKSYPKLKPCPQIVSNTVILHDTIIHRIVDTVPYYIVRRDSIIYRDIIFKDIDTAAILRNFYAIHYFTRTWEDSLLSAKSEDAISQNEFVDNKFTYRILRTQSITYTTVDNSVVYNKYILLGLNVPIQDYQSAQIEAIFVMPKFYLGAGFGTKGLSVKAGGTLFKLK
jgi:hypothetical protein